MDEQIVVYSYSRILHSDKKRMIEYMPQYEWIQNNYVK